MGKYSIITFENRKQLIENVIENKKPLKKTALKMNIKLSTAKSIIRNFRIYGKILCKKPPKQEIRTQMMEEISSASRKQSIQEVQSIKEQLGQDIRFTHIEYNQNQIQHSLNQSLTLYNCLFWNQYWWLLSRSIGHQRIESSID